MPARSPSASSRRCMSPAVRRRDRSRQSRRPPSDLKGFADFLGIRHLLLENYARNTFTRFGVPYVVSILCFDGGSRYRMISCRDAGKVAERFLKALHVAGGAPPRQVEAIETPTLRSEGVRGFSRDPPPFARELRTQHLHPFWRALCGLDPVLRRRLALPHDLLSRCRQGRRALPQGAACRRRCAAATGRGNRDAHPPI